MAGLKIESIVPPVRLGEGPHWMESHKALLFVDIPHGDVHRYFTETGRHQTLHIDAGNSGGTVSLVVPVEGQTDVFLISVGRCLGVIRWSASDPDHCVKKAAVLHTIDDHLPTNRFNDGKCDPLGRLWAGTMAKETGGPGKLDMRKAALYRLDSDLKLTQCVDKITLSNGLCWSQDHRIFYYIDSCAYSVDSFDYDNASGKIDNRRVVLSYKSAGLSPDIPDGMTIDANGNLWVANYLGTKILCIDPVPGKIIRTIAMPCQNLTSVCWGGEEYSVLYATSSVVGLTEEQLSKQPQSGATFAITGLGVKGTPPVCYKPNADALDKILASL